MDKIELLSPAGDLERLKVTLSYGADAVYIGGRQYSLRANATNFSIEEIKEGCDFAHKLNKKVYLTLNIVFHNEDMDGVEEYIKEVVDAGIDVCIGTDGAGSNNCLDMFKEMHLLYSLAKIKESDATTLKAFDILKMATVNGAKALGLDDALYIEEGAKADLILIDLLKPNMQPINNLISNIVYSGSKDNIKL